MVCFVLHGGMHRRAYLKRGGIAATGALIGLSGVGSVAGANFPDESLSWMIPWSEGGGTDQYARQLAPQMEDPLGESIEIDNREGAGSLLGSEWLHGQDNDGHTFGTVNPPGWVFTWRVEEVEAWHVEDFEPISYAGIFGYTIIVNDTHDIDSYDELQDAYQDGELSNFAYQGVGSDSHLVSLLLRDEYGLEWDTAVPYDGGGPVNEAVISDEVPAGIATNTSAIAAEESGEVSAVVNLMDIDLTDTFPEIDEITDYGDSLAWLTEFTQVQIAPPDTPEDVREVISEAVREATEAEDTQEWEEDTGNIIEYGDMDEAADRYVGQVEVMEEEIQEVLDGGFDEFQELIEEEE